jgi:hypothetical protein
MKIPSVTETVAADHRSRLQAVSEANRLSSVGRRLRPRSHRRVRQLAPIDLTEKPTLSVCIDG